MGDTAIHPLDPIDLPASMPAAVHRRGEDPKRVGQRTPRRAAGALLIGVAALFAAGLYAVALEQRSDMAETSALLTFLQQSVDVSHNPAVASDPRLTQLTELVEEQTRARHVLIASFAVAGIGVALLAAGLLTQFRRQARELEQRVAQRTQELSEVNRRFDLALQASGTVVFAQDRDLVYTWLSHGAPNFPAERVLGKSDAELLPPSSCAAIEELKRRALATGMPARGEVSIEADGQAEWWELTVVPATEDGSGSAIVGAATHITGRKQAEEQVRLLVSEVTHRSKNLLSVVQAVMRQTAAHSATIEEFRQRFSERMNSLAASHDLLAQRDWQGAALHDLVRSQLAHWSDAGTAQIEIEGDPVTVSPVSAQHIGMALHELASNAMRYGALSTPNGHVRVAWSVAADGAGGRVCRLSWSESDGPPVQQATRSGFGRVVIERTVAHALNGKVDLDYAADGVHWAITFPLAA